jgi:lysophospholipase L1-like esterase
VGGSGGSTSQATNGGSGGAANGGAGEELAPLPSVARIMAIGDSVTRATCWRARLWEQLNQSFAGRFDFVGTLSSDSGCMPSGYDRDNQGYSSSLITEIVGGITTARTCDPNPCPALADLQAAFAVATPDLVLLHFGTNDVWNSRAPADITSGYSAVVDALRAVNPDVRVLAAQIIPMNVTATTCMGCSCAGCPTGIQTLNTQIVAWAAGKATPRSPIYVVDQWTGFDTAVDTNDGVHPNAAGSQKMAGAWFEALEPLFALP